MGYRKDLNEGAFAGEDLCSSCVRSLGCILREGNDGFVYACGEYVCEAPDRSESKGLAAPAQGRSVQVSQRPGL